MMKIWVKFKKLFSKRNGTKSGEKLTFHHFYWLTWCKCVPTSRILCFKFMVGSCSSNTKTKWIQFSSKWSLQSLLPKSKKMSSINRPQLTCAHITIIMEDALMANVWSKFGNSTKWIDLNMSFKSWKMSERETSSGKIKWKSNAWLRPEYSTLLRWSSLKI